MCTAVKLFVKLEVSIVPIGAKTCFTRCRARTAATRTRPEGSSWAARTFASASPCQYSSKAQNVRNVVMSGSLCAGVTNRSRK